MPVVRLNRRRFSRMVDADTETILERLPYIGLDIESVTPAEVRVEYSPNRPDFGTDFGISRALRGLLGKEVGLPRYPVSRSGVSVSVGRNLSAVRPFIACVVATGLRLDDEDIRQVISLQEDLHNGLGRKRRVVAIGIHDFDRVSPPLSYRGVSGSFKFTPLGKSDPASVKSIVANTPEGKAYGSALGSTGVYPLITDSEGTVLSLPPIINGATTKVTKKTNNLFVDVTSTDMRAGDDVLAILATTLASAGGALKTVKVQYPDGPRVTPDLAPVEVALDLPLVRSTLGMDLTKSEVSRALGRSRLSVTGDVVAAPRYRIDLFHPVDIAEEVALGYGMDRITPVYPSSESPGAFNAFEDFLDATSTVMAGAGMVELMTFELTDAKSLYSHFGRSPDARISVMDPKSLDHSVLRDALIPSVMATLKSNVRADYPQRVFEIGRVYERTRGGVSERWHLGCLVAHSQASFTEAKMYLEAALRIIGGEEAHFSVGNHWAFTSGRCAAVSFHQRALGYVGEVRPEAVEATGLGVPVSGFEVDLSSLHELLK